MTLIGAMGAIRRHLFVLAPNNSGSTFLTKAIAGSPGAWALPREGQHVPGFTGPSSRGTGAGLLWAADAETVARFTDPAAYDWERNRRAWHFHARTDHPGGTVLVLSSPPFLLIADQLAAAFPDARFVVLVRNPWATIEGIVRGSPGEPAEILPAAVRHVIAALEQQRRNQAQLGPRGLAISYEEMCREPEGVGARIAALVPELGTVALRQRLAVKGNYDEELRDMNADQIARLSPTMRAAIDKAFEPHSDLLAAFGYRSPAP